MVFINLREEFVPFIICFKSSLLAALLTLPIATHALQLDAQAPITIESDSAERNEKTGITEYRGNVIIVQGNLSITANRVTIAQKGNRVVTIRCEGSPASFRQTLAHTNDDLLIGRANDIKYAMLEQAIYLTDNASLSRKGTIVKGDSIYYDIKNDIWKARGNSATEQKRIQLVIPPVASQTDLSTEPDASGGSTQ